MKYTVTILTTLASCASAASFLSTAGTYISSVAADTNYSGNNSLIVNSRSDTPHYDRFIFYNFDISSYANGFDSVSLTVNTTNSTGTGFDIYYFDNALDLSTLTWNTAATASIVPSTADGSFTGGTLVQSYTGSYSASTATTFTFDFTDFSSIQGDSDGIFTLAIVDTDFSNAYGIFDRTTASVNVIPEPSALALLGLGGVALLSKRKR